METDPTALDLHRRLLADDPVVPSEIAERFLDELARVTRRALSPGEDEHMANDAAADALLNYLERPTQFDPTRGSLSGYLRMAAVGDLRNLRAKESVRRRRRSHVDVELADQIGKTSVEEGATDDDIARVHRLEATALDLTRNDEESEVMSLMLEGERRTEAYAHVMKISDQPIDQQRRFVKRMKDRLKKRLERSGWGTADE